MAIFDTETETDTRKSHDTETDTETLHKGPRGVVGVHWANRLALETYFSMQNLILMFEIP